MVVIHDIFLFLYKFGSCAFNVADIKIVSDAIFGIGALLAFVGQDNMIALVLKVMFFGLDFGGEFQARLVDGFETAQTVVDFDHVHFGH
jgi:hypothetical protein